jgi:uncharacterized BrkB/YihY/UPF0761 family membrane protein
VLFTDWRWAVNGRRSVARRGEEAALNGVDIYERRLFLIALGIFTLSCLDAAFTLTLVRMGIASEANPLMSALLAYDTQIFVNLKIVLTGAGCVFLVALADATLLKRVTVRRLMHVLLGTYIAVVGWEMIQFAFFR